MTVALVIMIKVSNFAFKENRFLAPLSPCKTIFYAATYFLPRPLASFPNLNYLSSHRISPRLMFLPTI